MIARVVDWRVAQCELAAFDLRYKYYMAEQPDVAAESPDVVIIATAAWPTTTL